MTSVLLDSFEVTTDPLAGLAVGNVAYTHAVVSWQNPSASTATFRIVNESGAVVTSEVSVASGQSGSATVFPLSPGGSYQLYLERYEIDTWIRQTSTSSLDYVLISTPTTSATVVSGSTTARATFQAPVAGANLFVTYRAVGDTQSAYKFATVSMIETTGQALMTGLSEGVTYDVNVGVYYPQYILDEFSPGTTSLSLHQTTFTTSSNAEMVLTGPFASYMGIDWSASVDGQGSNYRIVNRVNSSDDVLAESSTATAATIQDLQPGTEYRIVLQRLELDNVWSDQNEVVANTLTSSMSINSVLSKTLQVSWQPLYAGANFEVLYSASGSSKSSGQTQDTTTILRDLSPGTTYELNLVVYELGQAVGLARLGMTTKEGLKSKLTLGAVVVAVLLAVFMVMKKR